MSERGSDRIKVEIEWTSIDTSVLCRLANNAIERLIDDAAPSAQDLHIETYIRMDATVEQTEEGMKHKRVYRFRYKRASRNIRPPRLWHVFHFVMALRKMEEELAGSVPFKVTVDVQANRLPWVFHDATPGKKCPTMLAARPGAVQYELNGDKLTIVPGLHDDFAKLVSNGKDGSMCIAKHFMVIGEPTAALKAARYFQRMLYTGKLPTPDQTMATAIPDLVCVLYRATTKREWQLYDDGVPQMHGEYLRHVLTGNSPEDRELPDLGLRYELIDLQK